MPNIFVPQVDIWGPYYRSLEGIGHGVGSIAGAYYGSKYAKERRKKEEEEEYRKQRQREEEEYRLKKQRGREEADKAREQAAELLTRKYQGYELANPPLRVSETQPLSRVGQRMEENPSSLAHLLRARLEEMTPKITEKTETPDLPQGLDKGIYDKIIETALTRQGRLPGASEWTSAGDGSLYNKYTAETRSIPGWRPKPSDRFPSKHLGKNIWQDYDAEGKPYGKPYLKREEKEGKSPDDVADSRANRIRDDFRMRAFARLSEKDIYTGRSAVPKELKDAEQFLIGRATKYYAYDNLNDEDAWNKAWADAKQMGLIPQPAPAAPSFMSKLWDSLRGPTTQEQKRPPLSTFKRE